MINKFDQKTCKELKDAVMRALGSVGDQYGVKFLDKSGNFTDSTMSFRIEAAIIRDGQVLSREAEDFKNYTYRHGLKESDLFREFVCDGKTFKLVGYSTRARKFPMIAREVATDEEYTFSIASIKYHLDN